MSQKKYQRATVYWDDAWDRMRSTMFNNELSQKLLESCPMESTGWIVAKDRKRPGLAFELDEEQDARFTQSIPRKMITRIEYLEPVERPVRKKERRDASEKG